MWNFIIFIKSLSCNIKLAVMAVVELKQNSPSAGFKIVSETSLTWRLFLLASKPSWTIFQINHT